MAVPSRLFDARTFVVVSTRYVVPPSRMQQEPYYEIKVACDFDPDAPRMVVVTRDEELYTRAAFAEGYDDRFSVTWRVLQGTCRSYDLLESLEPVPLPRHAAAEEAR